MTRIASGGREFRTWETLHGTWTACELDANGGWLQIVSKLATEAEALSVIERWQATPTEASA